MIPIFSDRLFLTIGDITKQKVDAIVNAANESLQVGTGVDGAIHLAGGPSILEECMKIGGCKTGQAVITGGGLLTAKYVIHTVGPIWKEGGNKEDELLVSCYRNSLAIARKKKLASIAFPAISTGAYSFPADRAVYLVIPYLLSYCVSYSVPKMIKIVCYDAKMFDLYHKAISVSSRKVIENESNKPTETIKTKKSVKSKKG
jgi:O-acetyl-ADP-ribose deacetylase (regulator of RNase III)